MEINGIAALGVWPVTVELGGTIHRIAPLPAIRWIVPIVNGDWTSIIPGLFDQDDTAIDDLLRDGVVDLEDCAWAAMDAVGVASGMPWWSAAMLVNTATRSAEVMGALTLAGVDPRSVGLSAFVCSVYRVIVENADDKQREKMDAQLRRPPAGIPLERTVGSADDPTGFNAMMRQRGLA